MKDLIKTMMKAKAFEMYKIAYHKSINCMFSRESIKSEQQKNK